MTRASIVVPAYNVAQYLPRCVESLLAQSEPSIEIIIVNDGSTDGMTGSIADDFAAQDPRVRVCHRVNGGLSAARNTGMRMAVGEHLFFVDGDDWVEPDMVDSMIGHCVSTGAQVAVAGAYVDFHDRVDNRVRSETRLLPHIVIDSGTPLEYNLVSDNFVNLVGYAWNKAYQRNWLMSLGVEFEAGLVLIEDVEFNTRVMAAASRIALVPRAFVHYIQRPRQTLGTTHDETYLVKRLRAIRCVDRLLLTWRLDPAAGKKRRAKASSGALWAALRSSARSSANSTQRRDALTRMLAQPQVSELLEMVSTDGSAGIRGRWATLTIGRGWYSAAFLPIVVHGVLVRLWSQLTRKPE